MNRDAGNISLGNSGLWRCKYCDEEDSSCAFAFAPLTSVWREENQSQRGIIENQLIYKLTQ
jgi:hypothetical protein